MFVKTLTEKKTGRTLIMIVEGYSEQGKVRHRMIERIGYVDEFTHLYADPVAHFKQIARQMTREQKERQKAVVVELMPEAILPFNKDTGRYSCVKNLGYAAISLIFHHLGIHQFFDDRRKYLDLSYNLTAVSKLLVYGRILTPESKRATWLSKESYFDKMDFDLNAVYRSLSIFPRWRDALLGHLHRKMVELYGRDSTLLFYDVTNYYFEIDDEDDFRRRGNSKENRRSPIIQMGLFMDDKGFPVTYDLFAGNTNEGTTFSPMSKSVREQLEMDHIIFVADKAMMSGNNVADVITNHNGYIFSKSVRGGTQELKDAVRDPRGYLEFDGGGRQIASYDRSTPVAFKYKVLDEVKETYVKDVEGNRRKVKGVGHYQIIYWSAKYAARAKVDRQYAIEKAVVASHSKSKDVIDNKHGKNKYLKTQVYDKQTKQRLEEYDAKVVFDFGKLEEDESLDGFYIIETNVTGLRVQTDARGRETEDFEPPFGKKSRWLEKEGMLQLNRVVTPLDIIGMYRGLWKIEQSFRITKSELDARPVYVSREDRIGSHFLTCFIALLIVRILEHEMEYEFSSEQIIKSLRAANVAQLNANTYLTLEYNEVLKKLKQVLGIEFGRKVYTQGEIRKMMAATKKRV
ncbi:MAG: IS1634 family transposase [Sphaerochaetaceae bacterium]